MVKRSQNYKVLSVWICSGNVLVFFPFLIHKYKCKLGFVERGLQIVQGRGNVLVFFPFLIHKYKCKWGFVEHGLQIVQGR